MVTPAISRAIAGPEVDRPGLVRAAFRLEILTLAWMTIETVVAILSGLTAGSLTITAFGLDSIIELGSAAVLIWRLSMELHRGRAFPEAIEHRAGRIAGLLLFALAGYILTAACWRLWSCQGGGFSLSGLIIATLAIPMMYLLAQRKRVLAEQLGSRAMRADAAESVACLSLSLVVVVGQGAELAISAWWVDPVASLAVLWFVLREAREAWSGEACC